MKTIEDRAAEVMSVFTHMLIETVDNQVMTGADLKKRIAEAMRELVKDAAKTAYQEGVKCMRGNLRLLTCCTSIEIAIRALGEPEAKHDD